MYAPGLVVAGIGLEELAAAEVISLDICSYAYIVRVGIGLEGSGTPAIVRVGPCDIETCADVEAEGFEAIYLIVQGSSADESFGSRVTYVPRSLPD